MSQTNQSDSLTGLIIWLVIVGLFDAGAIWFINGLISDGVIWLTAAFVVVTIFINIVFFLDRFYPIRWMVIGLALMMLLAVYPMLFTIYVAFTNYGDGSDTMLDQETGLVYAPIDRTFTAEDGSTLAPGYSVPIGLENFQRFFRSSAIQGRLLRVVIWNFAVDEAVTYSLSVRSRDSSLSVPSRDSSLSVRSRDK